MLVSRALVEAAVREKRNTPISESASLQHYASPYYDPVKAKEYYERTKKLKGEQPAALTSTQKEVFDVSKDSIATAKKQELEKADVDQIARIEAFQSKALEVQRSFADKLVKLSGDNSDLPLNKIPRNATPAQKAFLEKENNRIRSGAKKKAIAERKEIGESLRRELQQIRDDYKAQLEATREKYKSAIETEEANIRTQVA